MNAVDQRLNDSDLVSSASADRSRHGAGAADAKTDARFFKSTPQNPDSGSPARCHIRLADEHTGIATLLTGLALLARSGRAELSWECIPRPKPLQHGPWHLRDKGATNAELVIDGRHRVFLDIHDSFELDETAMASHDVYFKRSLRQDAVGAANRARLQALGLVYAVHPDGFDREQLRRIMAGSGSTRQRGREMFRALASMTAAAINQGGRPTLSQLQGPPTRTRDPQVLFMVGLWDPALVPDIAPEKIAEFDAVNAMRAQCVRALRREFGARFHGGVQHTEFSRRRFADVLLEDDAEGSKRAFLQRVRHSAVCVTTTGLHGSNGWKLAEYVGLSRAIVSEPLRYHVPGGFAAGRHYLAFDSPDRCVEQVARLMEHHDERDSMMESNERYAREWMHPERLAWRVINAARAGTRP